MWWKIYFWILIALVILGSFALLQDAPLTPFDIIGLIMELFLIIGLFSYVFKKNILEAKYWKILFYLYAISTVVGFLDLYALPDGYLENMFPFLKSNINTSEGGALFAIIFYIPAYYALYQLGFKKKKLSKK